LAFTRYQKREPARVRLRRKAQSGGWHRPHGPSRYPSTPLPSGTDGLRANRSTREGNLATVGVGSPGPKRVETAPFTARRMSYAPVTSTAGMEPTSRQTLLIPVVFPDPRAYPLTDSHVEGLEGFDIVVLGYWEVPGGTDPEVARDRRSGESRSVSMRSSSMPSEAAADGSSPRLAFVADPPEARSPVPAPWPTIRTVRRRRRVGGPAHREPFVARPDTDG